VVGSWSLALPAGHSSESEGIARLPIHRFDYLAPTFRQCRTRAHAPVGPLFRKWRTRDFLFDRVAPGRRDLLATKTFEPCPALRGRLSFAVIDEKRSELVLEL